MYLLFLVAFAALFYRAADYERLNPFIWAVASLGITGVMMLRGAAILPLFLAQAGLFGVMWWYNIWRKKRVS